MKIFSSITASFAFTFVKNLKMYREILEKNGVVLF